MAVNYGRCKTFLKNFLVIDNIMVKSSEVVEEALLWLNKFKHCHYYFHYCCIVKRHIVSTLHVI